MGEKENVLQLIKNFEVPGLQHSLWEHHNWPAGNGGPASFYAAVQTKENHPAALHSPTDTGQGEDLDSDMVPGKWKLELPLQRRATLAQRVNASPSQGGAVPTWLGASLATTGDWGTNSCTILNFPSEPELAPHLSFRGMTVIGRWSRHQLGIATVSETAPQLEPRIHPRGAMQPGSQRTHPLSVRRS